MQMTLHRCFRFVALLVAPCVAGCSTADPDVDFKSAAGSGGAAGSAGASATGGSGAGTPATGGSGVGLAGSAGAAGSASGGSGGGSGSAGGATGGSTAVPCPADKTFCSGFEEAALPAGAVYKVNAAPGEWTRDFEIDTTVFRGGKSSLKVKSSDAGTSGSAYQMLAVPAPTGKFWARFYVRQADLDIGGLGHNVFAGASDSEEPNSSVMVELAEDVGVAFNTSDNLRWPMGFGRINGSEKPFTLVKGAWHCIEISYDSEARVQKLFVNGTLQIDAADYPMTVASPFKFFKFGFNKLHGPARAVWYDDVAVGPTRPGCL